MAYGTLSTRNGGGFNWKKYFSRKSKTPKISKRRLSKGGKRKTSKKSRKTHRKRKSSRRSFF